MGDKDYFGSVYLLKYPGTLLAVSCLLFQTDVLVHAYNFAYQRLHLKDVAFKATLGYIARPCLKTKVQKESFPFHKYEFMRCFQVYKRRADLLNLNFLQHKGILPQCHILQK